MCHDKTSVSKRKFLNIVKGITDPNGLNALTTVTAVKGCVTLPKRMIFFEKFPRGGGGGGQRGGTIIKPKNNFADYRPLNTGNGRLELF